MDNNLTPEEERVLYLVECAGDWDPLIYGLLYLIPCMMLIGIGAVIASKVAVFSGALSFTVFFVWHSVRQTQMSPLLHSAIRKLRKAAECAQPNETQEKKAVFAPIADHPLLREGR